MDTTVQQAGRDREPLAVDILADAFRGDPVMNWIGPTDHYPQFAFTLALSIFAPHQRLYLTGDESGAAIWLPPGVRTSRLAGLRILRKTWWQYGGRCTWRCLTVLDHLDRHHPTEPHHYLFAVGVRAAERGRGIGSALLRHVLDQADRQGQPAYLENTHPDNLALYQRHGFRVRHQLQLPRGGPPVWLMWRRPREQGAGAG
ncbi:MAG: GNAT family N-acetyltransferase [Planctomycetales bacterium]|nr:GNAT family N-acetyltransferase [Planctomycetales bacterium]